MGNAGVRARAVVEGAGEALSWGEDRDEDDEGDVCEEREDRRDAAAEPPGPRVMLYLRIIEGHSFLRVSIPDAACLWDGQERGDPPQRAEYEADEEYPGMQRRALLIAREETW